ncbi:DUF2614 family zinc ribbon-containing protein [Desmospora activa]|uniref:Zinc ribbon protein n=1 Tax=Desmospora activa DSM 45169 TaxID=1121389 RepID=A0A2T4Z3D2_9BACL|nr:DUF2614 family zinc ribbon-containing protein [Desmospora activa]PTM56405.1 zinc ribbon protein [Desmospora activa DSM 45169]
MFAGKINKFRTVALLLIFLGIGVMYFGFLWPSAMLLFILLGMLFIGGSVAIYFWVGMLSTQAAQVECPECKRTTKVLGKTDQCMFCKSWLSFDPKYASDEDR